MEGFVGSGGTVHLRPSTSRAGIEHSGFFGSPVHSVNSALQLFKQFLQCECIVVIPVPSKPMAIVVPQFMPAVASLSCMVHVIRLIVRTL